MIVKSLSGMVIKPRPGRYNLEGYQVGGKAGYVIAQRPRAYPITPQQRKMRDVARGCGIQKGMTRRALVTAMKTCIPGAFH
jgi:hypothetical protein